MTETAPNVDAKPETHDVLMSNGMVITDVPIGYGAKDVVQWALLAQAMHEQMKFYPPCMRLQSRLVH